MFELWKPSKDYARMWFFDYSISEYYKNCAVWKINEKIFFTKKLPFSKILAHRAFLMKCKQKSPACGIFQNVFAHFDKKLAKIFTKHSRSKVFSDVNYKGWKKIWAPVLLSGFIYDGRYCDRQERLLFDETIWCFFTWAEDGILIDWIGWSKNSRGGAP